VGLVVLLFGAGYSHALRFCISRTPLVLDEDANLTAVGRAFYFALG